MFESMAFRKAFESGSLGLDVLNYMLQPFTQSTAQALIKLVNPNLYWIQEQTEKEKLLMERVTPSTRWPNQRLSVGELRDLLTETALDYRKQRGWVSRSNSPRSKKLNRPKPGWDEENLTDLDISIKVTKAMWTVIQNDDKNAIIALITA